MATGTAAEGSCRSRWWIRRRRKTGDIRIELRRGTTAMTIRWPVAAATDCAAWLRELLR